MILTTKITIKTQQSGISVSGVVLVCQVCVHKDSCKLIVK